MPYHPAGNPSHCKAAGPIHPPRPPPTGFLVVSPEPKLIPKPTSTRIWGWTRPFSGRLWICLIITVSFVGMLMSWRAGHSARPRAPPRLSSAGSVVLVNEWRRGTGRTAEASLRRRRLRSPAQVRAREEREGLQDAPQAAVAHHPAPDVVRAPPGCPLSWVRPLITAAVLARIDWADRVSARPLSAACPFR